MATASRKAWTKRVPLSVALGGAIGLGLVGIKQIHTRLDEIDAVSGHVASRLYLTQPLAINSCKVLHATTAMDMYRAPRLGRTIAAC